MYRWPDLATPLRTGDLRDELGRVCLGQALAAGLVEGRLHVAAYALGASASGMTFLDSEVPSLLQEADDIATLLFTCVGVPAYATRPGGDPGSPVEVRAVTPRPGSG